MEITESYEAFNKGEIGPKLMGRTSLDAYAASCRRLENMVAIMEGPAIRRGGTKYMGTTLNQDKKTKLIPWTFKNEETYLLEFTEKKIRIWFEGAILEDPDHAGQPLLIDTPYTEAQLDQIRFAQSKAVMFLVHPDVKPKALTRTGVNKFTFTDFAFENGPYLTTNSIEEFKMKASGATDAVTVTASGSRNGKNNEPFASTDVGRHITLRTEAGKGWGWGVITKFTSNKVVTVQVKGGKFPTANTDDWALGSWSDTTGWPSYVGFGGTRSLFACTPKSEPLSFWGSELNNFWSFNPFDRETGQVTDATGFNKELNTGKGNKLTMMLNAQYMAFATEASFTRVVTPPGIPISAKNGDPKTDSGKGSADIIAQLVENSIIYVDTHERDLMRAYYLYEGDSYKPERLTLMSGHLTKKGIKTFTYQSNPYSVLWVLTNDGKLCGCTFTEELAVVGWHKHDVGGTVEDILSIPSGDKKDHLYLIVRRDINGTEKRYIERLDGSFEEFTDKDDCYYVDCGVVKTTDAPTKTVDGLDHLEGMRIQSWIDGAVGPELTVSSGSVTLPYAMKRKGAFGLAFKSLLVPHRPIQTGGVMGIQKRRKRYVSAYVRVDESSAFQYGTAEDNLYELSTAVFNRDAFGEAPELLTGDVDLKLSSRHTPQPDIYIAQNSTGPLNLLALYIQMDVTN